MEYYVEKRVSSICKRNTHTKCKNKNDHCGCECHVVIRKNIEMKKQSLEQLDKWMNEQWRAFWRPFLP